MILNDLIKSYYYKIHNLLNRKEPRGQELINRYRDNYGIPNDAHLSEDNILNHWKLEKELTQKLLSSNSENRWEVFEHCYTTLYSELDWLNKFNHTNTIIEPVSIYASWSDLIGVPPKTIYEVGSGRGELISYLASLGHKCKATEITRERGKKHVVNGQIKIDWGISDGIHLSQFEQNNTYDIVISNQVVEHMHPDDLVEHFKNTLAILKPGGKYIVCIPHVWHGPADISAVFKYNKAVGMHLKEYTNFEIYFKLKLAGYAKVESAFISPKSVTKNLASPNKTKSYFYYLVYLIILERLFMILPRPFVTYKVKLFAKQMLFMNNVFLVAQK